MLTKVKESEAAEGKGGKTPNNHGDHQRQRMLFYKSDQHHWLCIQ